MSVALMASLGAAGGAAALRRRPTTDTAACRRRAPGRRAPARAAAEGEPGPAEQQVPPPPPPASAAAEDAAPPQRSRGSGARRAADSTDPIASALTRRFGLAGGLAWLGVLTFGVVSEQVKTRLEVAAERDGTRDAGEAPEVTTPSGLRYRDERIGGGATPPQRGYLLAAQITVTQGGRVLFDTREKNRPLAFFFGGRPLSGALCAGVEEGLATMRAGGVRRMVIPEALGPPPGARFPGGEVEPGGGVEYRVELQRVSVPPS